MLITQSPTVKPRSGSGSANTNQDAATKQDSAAAGGLLAVTVNGNGSEPASQPNASSSNVPSFLGKKFASFNVLHSKWRHRDESTLDRCKGLSKSLENLQDTLPAKDAKRKAPQPPDRPHRQKSAPDVSAPVDSDEDDFEVVQMPSGYEDIEIIPRARTKRVQTTQTAEGKDISAVEKDESEASKLTGAGAAQAIKRFIVSAGRKVSTSTGAESQDATPSAGHSSPQTGIGASGDKKPQGARKELAYDQVRQEEVLAVKWLKCVLLRHSMNWFDGTRCIHFLEVEANVMKRVCNIIKHILNCKLTQDYPLNWW